MPAQRQTARIRKLDPKLVVESSPTVDGSAAHRRSVYVRWLIRRHLTYPVHHFAIDQPRFGWTALPALSHSVPGSTPGNRLHPPSGSWFFQSNRAASRSSERASLGRRHRIQSCDASADVSAKGDAGNRILHGGSMIPRDFNVSSSERSSMMQHFVARAKRVQGAAQAQRIIVSVQQSGNFRHWSTLVRISQPWKTAYRARRKKGAAGLC